jgi:hypothetical protein
MHFVRIAKIGDGFDHGRRCGEYSYVCKQPSFEQREFADHVDCRFTGSTTAGARISGQRCDPALDDQDAAHGSTTL